MNELNIDALDRRLDARADGGLISALAGLRPADWPERAAADRIAGRVASALTAGPASTAQPGAPARRARRRNIPTRRAMAASSAAAVAAAAAVVAMHASSPRPAPLFHAQFRALILATTSPSQHRRHAHQWQLASYLITPGWRARDLTSPPGSLSCPSVMTCYVTAANPVPFRTLSHTVPRYNIVQVTRDSGGSWTAFGLPADVSFTTAIQCPRTASACVAGANDGPSAALLRTADGGRSWSAQRLGFTPYVNDLACSSDLNCVGIFTRPKAASPSYDVRYTRDGGRTWAAGPQSPRGQQPDYLTCHGTRCVLFDQLIVRDNNKSVSGAGPVTVAPGIWAIWTSDDGGQRWRRGTHPAGYWPLPSGDTPAPQAVSCADPAHCWALASTNWFYPYRPGRPAVLATTDGGLHWSAHPMAPLTAGSLALAIACPAPQLCLAGAGEPRPEIAQTSDGGMTWTELPLPPSVARIRTGQANTTGLLPWVRLLSCPAEQHCLAIIGANPNARRIPVLSLTNTARP